MRQLMGDQRSQNVVGHGVHEGRQEPEQMVVKLAYAGLALVPPGPVVKHLDRGEYELQAHVHHVGVAPVSGP
jgi:hypothetical protein